MRPEHCFAKLNKDNEIAPLIPALLDLVERAPELWTQITARQETPGSPHHDTQCIVLLGPTDLSVHGVFNDLKVEVYPAGRYLHDAASPLVAAMQEYAFSYESEPRPMTLGRVMIVNLRRDGVIDPHYDDGAYADHYDRFHLCLRAQPGVRFNVADQHFEALPGELWWFNHKLTHSLVNLSGADRWHLIVDMVAPYWRMERNKGLAASRSNGGRQAHS